jgi:hypothetical protein
MAFIIRKEVDGLDKISKFIIGKPRLVFKFVLSDLRDDHMTTIPKADSTIYKK